MKHARAAVSKGNVLALRGGLAWLACLALGACGGSTLTPEPTDPPAEVDTHPATEGTATTAAGDPDAPATVGAAKPSPFSPPEPSLPSQSPTNETDDERSAVSANPFACSYPSTRWSPPEWVPYAPTGSGAGADAASLLSGVQAAMVGRWHGQVTTPWTSPYEVDVTFDADGHYSASCSDPAIAGCCRAFYYGTDDDTPIKQWRVNDATLGGDVFGQIDIAFDYRNETGVDYGLPAWQGELSRIARNAAGDGLRFQFATSSGYGPVRYDLRRVE